MLWLRISWYTDAGIAVGRCAVANFKYFFMAIHANRYSKAYYSEPRERTTVNEAKVPKAKRTKPRRLPSLRRLSEVESAGRYIESTRV